MYSSSNGCHSLTRLCQFLLDLYPTVLVHLYKTMSPSATETVAPIAEHIKQKILPEAQKEGTKESPKADNALAVGGTDLEDELPKLETAHKEPLKLSGALNQFKQFDVTPVIGKEFIDVDLAEWLRAPNSDELLRDLAITSTRKIQFPAYSAQGGSPSALN